METIEDEEELKTKKIKDPLYGYIEVPNKFVVTFIDTPCFQRLRHVIQTSYSSVYMTALHNRFTHSLGVYHLGKIVYGQIKTFMRKKRAVFKFEDELINWMATHEEIFLVACLLHDVGHAPFSHTGEVFYDTNINEFYNLLYDSVNDSQFKLDAEKYRWSKPKKEANPHERMSVLIALQFFKEYFETKEPEDKEFFARCITGYKYSNVKTVNNQVKNCLIALLNSTLIDVDRLDYIIRDAFMSGYQNVSIDYERLLGGMVIVRDQNEIVLAYHKNAMSIIENVIYAHDCERKWIQSHPVILYEMFLIDHSIKIVQRFFDNKGEKNHPLFSISSLGKDGNSFGPLFENDESAAILNVSLLSDVDILYYIKNVSSCRDELTQEYFDRNSRRHPLWKSEGEYKHFLAKVESKDKLNDLFMDINRLFAELFSIHKLDILPVINDQALAIIKKNIDREIELKQNASKLERAKEYFEILRTFADEKDIDFDFVVIFADMFRSNFSKIEMNKIKIWYPYDSTSAVTIRSMDSILKADKNEYDKNYFYFYYKRKDSTKITIFDVTQLCNKLVNKYIEVNQPKWVNSSRSIC
jgi:HD superfamily phosphohydrolase